MSQNLSLARRYAYSLARDYMTCIVLFRSELGYGVVLEDEYDGDPAAIIHKYDPFA